jgi:hypothetical protein
VQNDVELILKNLSTIPECVLDVVLDMQFPNITKGAAENRPLEKLTGTAPEPVSP